MKKMTFDKDKLMVEYLYKIGFVICGCIILFLILLLSSGIKSVASVFEMTLIVLGMGVVYLIFDFIVVYKSYTNSAFEFLYEENSFVYKRIYMTGLFESMLKPFQGYAYLEVIANNIEKIEIKHGKITVYGIMTEQKEMKDVKEKIIGKFTFKDYFKETDDFIKLINKD